MDDNTYGPGQVRDTLLATLASRFEQHPERHPDLIWDDVRTRLLSTPDKLPALAAMEATGGEPDVVAYDTVADVYVFFDCSPESPAGRRNLCYDQEALDARKHNKPSGSAVGMAEDMGIGLLEEEQYRTLQKLGAFDTKTSSWVATPLGVRELGGALFCDRRYNRVFTFHNGAESYYAARGFRGSLRV